MSDDARAKAVEAACQAVWDGPGEVYRPGDFAVAITAYEAALWQPIETAPHNVEVLLYCPFRAQSNPERIEFGYAVSGERRGAYSTMSRHGWATHWRPLPKGPGGG